jgi:hypothetical protein
VANGTLFQFDLIQNHSNPEHTLGRFRLSVTTDDRADFADGLDTGGDVSASWTVLKPEIFTSANGTTLEVLSDNSILASGTPPDTDTYTITARTPLSGITGFRLEALEDASLPVSGPGRHTANGNFVLSEFVVTMALLDSLADESGPPAYSAVDDFDSAFNGIANTWSYRWQEEVVRDGNYLLLPTFSADPVRWNPSIPLWTNGTNIPWVGVNVTGDAATWIGNANAFSWPDHTTTLHPGASRLVVVSWQSPVDGIYDVYFSFADMDPNAGDGVDWWVDLGGSDGELASGTLANGSQTGPRDALNVSVKAGERINFIVGPGAADEASFDSTRFDAVILQRPTPIIYGLKSFGTQEFNSTAPNVLFAIDQTGTTFDEIGTVELDTAQIDADGLAVSPTFGLRAFQITAGGSALLSLGKSDATATLLGEVLNGRDLRGAAFDPSDNLWAVDAANDEVMRINASTGEVSSTPVAITVNSAPFDLRDICDMAFDRHGNAILSSLADVYALNTQSGEATLLFTHAGQAFAGVVLSIASATEQTLFAYEVNGAEDLVAYDLEDGPPQMDLILNILPSFNAGRGDLGAEIRCRALEVVKPEVTFSRDGDNAKFEWDAAPNHSYQIRHTSDLQGDWSTNPEIPVGVLDDSATGEDIDALLDDQRFYSIEAKFEN